MTAPAVRQSRSSGSHRVGILSHNRVEFIDLLFVAAKTGLILVPLNTRYTGHEIEYIVRDSDMRALLYESDFAETLRSLRTSGIQSWVALDKTSGTDLSYSDACVSLTRSDWRPTRCDPEDLLCRTAGAVILCRKPAP